MKISDEDVDSHVELVSIEKERVCYVFLNDYIVSVVELSKVVYHFYASSPRFTDRFHNPVV